MNNIYENRHKVIIIIIVSIAFIFIIRLFGLQILNTTYKQTADRNVLRYIYETPSRGLIFDRNGKLLVFNDATYDLLVIPRNVKEFDTLKLCKLLEIDISQYTSRLKKAKNYSRLLPSVIFTNLSAEQNALIREQLFNFPGHYIQVRSVRRYVKPIAAHLLGYIGEVSPKTLEEDNYYRIGDYKGISGVEKSYEAVLRGIKGLRVVMVDVHSREMGSFEDGKHDIAPIAGENLYLSICSELQEYGELLMKNKRGGIVAIEPSTGEILASVTSPTYDPNLLVGAERNKNFVKLLRDTENNPLFNRAVMTRYPPGSTFKIVSAIAALNEGVITPSTVYSCGGGYNMGRHTIDCRPHQERLSLIPAVAYSCNTYFCWTFRHFIENSRFSSIQEGYERWRKYVNSMGFGVKLGTDFPNELAGFVPTAEFYNKRQRRTNWRANSIMSISIGQGEIGATPLQLANFTAIVANRGWYITPHIVRAIGNPRYLNPLFRKRVETIVKPATFEVFAQAMRDAVVYGTARVAEIPGYDVTGKTGTAQDPPRKNHSVFITFAPKNYPKIAIAVLVENSGYGSTYSAPIASLMMEKYLTGEVKRTELEERMINANLLQRW